MFPLFFFVGLSLINTRVHYVCVRFLWGGGAVIKAPKLHRIMDHKLSGSKERSLQQKRFCYTQMEYNTRALLSQLSRFICADLQAFHRVFTFYSKCSLSRAINTELVTSP